jgi:hypothetical protein
MGVLALLLCGALAGTAQATTTDVAFDGTNFQAGDGDQLAEDGHLDWQSLNDVVGIVDTDDTPTGGFTGGSKETEPGAWQLTSIGSPPKDNILDGWAKTEVLAANDHTILYLAFRREAPNGNTFLTFELNQRTDTWDNGTSAVPVPCREDGDLLISYEVEPGGTSEPDPVTIHLYKWIEDTEDAATGCSVTGHFDDLGIVNDAIGVQSAQAAINEDGDIENFLDTGDTAIATFEEGTFGEAAIDITAVFNEGEALPCFNFGQIQMHSRASSAIDSELKDFAGPLDDPVESCTASGEKFEDLNADGEFDEGEPGLEGWTIWADYNDDGILDADEPSDVTDANGHYSLSGLDQPYTLRELGGEDAADWTCSYPGEGETDDGPSGPAGPDGHTGLPTSDEGTSFDCGWGEIDPNETPTVQRDFGNYRDASVTVKKVLVSDDPDESGTFNLLVGGQTVATGGDGAEGTRDGLKPGGYVVSETGAGGTALGHYASSVSCDDGSAGAGTSLPVTVESGEHVTCTITNTAILNPAIAVDKKLRNAGGGGFVDGPIETAVGRNLEYQFIVTNPGNVALAVTLSDPRCDAGTMKAPIGDADGDGLLDLTESWVYTCTHLVTASDPDPLPNTVTATGTVPNHPPVSDQDSALADIVAQQTEPQLPGTARLRGPSGCVKGAFRATVRGTRIASVTFFVDGKRFKRLSSADGEGTRFSVKINPRGRGFGVHRITARVRFAAASNTSTRTLRLSFQRCKKQTVKPRFTG